jgi:hypothetical protein
MTEKEVVTLIYLPYHHSNFSSESVKSILHFTNYCLAQTKLGRGRQLLLNFQ